MTDSILPILFEKLLARRPEVVEPADFSLRTYRDEADIDAWLRVVNAAMRPLRTGDRDWRREHFHRELGRRPWWSPGCLWLAIAQAEGGATVVGVGAAKPIGDGVAVQWLAVAPDFQRRGVARAILLRIEAQCWDAGGRRVEAETSPDWSGAVAFYQRMGFARRI